jgi:hypothetical protein
MDKVKTVGREAHPFVLRVETADGRTQEYAARAVIDASGTWGTAQPAGGGGLPALGEAVCARWITYSIPDIQGRARARYANKTVLIVGSGHSAIHALLDLLTLREDAPSTRLLWAMRREQLVAVFGGGQADASRRAANLGNVPKRRSRKAGLRL